MSRIAIWFIIFLVVAVGYAIFNFYRRLRANIFKSNLKKGSLDLNKIREDLRFIISKESIKNENASDIFEKLNQLIDVKLNDKFILTHLKLISEREIVVTAFFSFMDRTGMGLFANEMEKVEDQYFLLNYNSQDNSLSISSQMFSNLEMKHNFKQFAETIFETLSEES